MFTKETERGERGQVGIGTLIVFIAMVLVAAIAAGVLINTAGLLQSQAEATGEESTDQVSNQVQIQSTTGDVNSDSIEFVNMVVSAAPGSSAIDLGDADYQYLGDEVYNLEEGDDDEIDFFQVSELSEDDPDSAEGDDLVIEPGEQVVIQLDFESGDSDLQGDLQEGDNAEFSITTADGAQTTEIFNVPSPLGSDDSVSL